MPFAEIDGLRTRYEITGEGPPLLMFSPGGFDARAEKWSDLGVYARIRLLEHMPAHRTCITFDRRENGQSEGRVERIGWAQFVRQGLGLLDHLGFERADMIGGCMGCCPLAALAVAAPERVRRMVLYWPVGGAAYRISSHHRFGRHMAYVEDHGLSGVVDLVRSHNKNFSADPRGGPWGNAIRQSEAFAEAYAALDKARYLLTVRATMQGLFDRDTAPGAEPEALMSLNIPALVIPGADGAHATSAARYLQECLPGAEYWDVPPEEQTADTAPARILEFLSRQD